MKLRSNAAVATLIAAAVVTTLASTADAADSGSRHLPKPVAAWADAWNGTDPDALGAAFTADGTYTDQAIGVTMTGTQQISGWKARTDALIDNAHVTVHSAHRDGHFITIEATYAGHIKGAPKPFAVPMATLLTTDGHRISSDRDYYALNAVLAQSGLPADWKPAGS
jgi:ketosteroid isomerase-like protein